MSLKPQLVIEKSPFPGEKTDGWYLAKAIRASQRLKIYQNEDRLFLSNSDVW